MTGHGSGGTVGVGVGVGCNGSLMRTGVGVDLGVAVDVGVDVGVGAVMVIVNEPEEVCGVDESESVTLIVKVVLEVRAVGVPWISPSVASNVSPDGSVPVKSVKVIRPEPPVAVIGLKESPTF